MPEITTLAALRHAIAPPASAGGRLRLGLPDMDAALGGGLLLAGAHEVLAEPGAGEAALGAATGFAVCLAASLLRQDGAGRPLLWVGSRPDLYPLGLCAYGLNPALLLLAAAPDQREALHTAETALRSGAVAAVLAELVAPDAVAARRLMLACQRGGATALILRHPPRGAPLTLATRWLIGPAPCQGRPRWQVTLIRAQGGRPGSWLMEGGSDIGFSPPPAMPEALAG